MRCSAWDAQKRFNSSEAERWCGEFKSSHDGIDLGRIAKLEREHAAKPPHLAFGERVLGMLRKPGIIHFGNRSVSRKESSDLYGIFIVLSDSHSEGFQATLELITSVGIEGATVVHGVLRQFVNYGARRDYNPGIHVGVAVEVFGRA